MYSIIYMSIELHYSKIMAINITERALSRSYIYARITAERDSRLYYGISNRATRVNSLETKSLCKVINVYWNEETV